MKSFFPSINATFSISITGIGQNSASSKPLRDKALAGDSIIKYFPEPKMPSENTILKERYARGWSVDGKA